MGGRGKCCCGCPTGVLESEAPTVTLTGATPDGDWINGPCCWERTYTATTPVSHIISGVRQISIQTEWVRTLIEHKRPWWTGTWDSATTPGAADQEVLFCRRAWRDMGELGEEKELIHQERAVISSRVKSITLKYHKVDVSETETPDIRHKFSLFVCYRMQVQFQGKTACYLRREWFDLYPTSCWNPFTPEYDNSPDTETIVNDTFDDEPEVPSDTEPNHCVCYNRTFAEMPSTIEFSSENNDELIELYCGCNVGTDFCVEVPASSYYDGLVYAAANPPVSSTIRDQSAGGSIGLRECVSPFNFTGTFNSTITCPYYDYVVYDPSNFNTAPASCIRFTTLGSGVNAAGWNTRIAGCGGIYSCPPYYNYFLDSTCPPEDAIEFCPGAGATERARWYSDTYSNAITVSSTSDIPTPPEEVCFDPVWNATVMLVEEPGGGGME